MTWELKNKIQEILAKETGAQCFAPGARRAFAFLYPNSYKVGMSNLGMHILYQIINGRGDTACERFFLPDGKTLAEYKRTKTPLMSMETQRQLADFEIIGVMMSFEMDYTNLLAMLQMSNIKLRAAERNEKEPLIVIGGPCAIFNPEPLAEVADAFVIGEGEEVINDLFDVVYKAGSRALAKKNCCLFWRRLKACMCRAFIRRNMMLTAILLVWSMTAVCLQLLNGAGCATWTNIPILQQF